MITNDLITKMTEFNTGDPKRIQHFIKVYQFAHLIGSKEGPAYAKEMLLDFPGVTEEETERICFLIAHHHTYDQVDGPDYRILLEADFLVNAFEDNLSKDAIIHFRDKVFETKTGLHLLNTMFGL